MAKSEVENKRATPERAHVDRFLKEFGLNTAGSYFYKVKRGPKQMYWGSASEDEYYVMISGKLYDSYPELYTALTDLMNSASSDKRRELHITSYTDDTMGLGLRHYNGNLGFVIEKAPAETVDPASIYEQMNNIDDDESLYDEKDEEELEESLSEDTDSEQNLVLKSSDSSEFLFYSVAAHRRRKLDAKLVSSIKDATIFPIDEREFVEHLCDWLNKYGKEFSFNHQFEVEECNEPVNVDETIS